VPVRETHNAKTPERGEYPSDVSRVSTIEARFTSDVSPVSTTKRAFTQGAYEERSEAGARVS
jgi:hypothetical protein